MVSRSCLHVLEVPVITRLLMWLHRLRLFHCKWFDSGCSVVCAAGWHPGGTFKGPAEAEVAPPLGENGLVCYLLSVPHLQNLSVRVLNGVHTVSAANCGSC